MISELGECHKSETYKVRCVTLDASLFITIVDDAEGRPVHMFINSKHVSSFEWMSSTLELLNAALRNAEFPLELIQRAAQVQDAHGGYWERGEHIPSVPAHIALVLLKHAEKRGFAAVSG